MPSEIILSQSRHACLSCWQKSVRCDKRSVARITIKREGFLKNVHFLKFWSMFKLIHVWLWLQLTSCSNAKNCLSSTTAAFWLWLSVQAFIKVWRDFEGLFMSCYFLFQAILLDDIIEQHWEGHVQSSSILRTRLKVRDVVVLSELACYVLIDLNLIYQIDFVPEH